MAQGKSLGNFEQYRQELKQRSFARAERFEVEFNIAELVSKNEDLKDFSSADLAKDVVLFCEEVQIPGMILSNEPGYYKNGHFGIRIENLVYVEKKNGKLFFKNLTMAPIERDLINFNLLTNSEKNYLFKYHLEVYSKLSKYLKPNERKWLASIL